jgi:hypothetical protein
VILVEDNCYGDVNYDDQTARVLRADDYEQQDLHLLAVEDPRTGVRLQLLHGAAETVPGWC